MLDKSNELYKKAIASGQKLVTIFTPTYNRCSLLVRVYNCLKKQSNKQFVWLVVCDGSTDNTDDIMLDIVQKNDLPIRYISKENGGKHTALKYGIDCTESDYFCDCDDDDTYSEDMVDVFLRVWHKIEVENRSDIGAVRALTQYENGEIVCNYNFDKRDLGTVFDATTLEMEYVHGLHQENQTCYSVNALRSVDLWPNNYWMSECHTFIGEGVWQGRFARKFKCRYIYKVVRIYNNHTEGLSRGRVSCQRALNSFLNLYLILNEQYDYISINKTILIKKILIMSVYRSLAGLSFIDNLRQTKNWELKLFLVLTLPIGNIVRKLKFKK